jgi:putative membrane protein
MNDPASRFAVKPSISNNYSWLRTRMAIERTQMAWARTGIALIAFGFTIVKFFEHLQSIARTRGQTILRPDAPRNLGLILIATGVLALAISIYQYQRSLRYLWNEHFDAIAGIDDKKWHTTGMPVAIVLLLTGVFAFVSVYFHVM